MFFDSLAYAEGAGKAAAAPGWLVGAGQMVPFIAIFAIFYFLLIRPQQKKQKDHDGLINNLKKGDKVLTQGGVRGDITKLFDDDSGKWVVIRVNNKVEIEFSRSAISSKLN